MGWLGALALAVGCGGGSGDGGDAGGDAGSGTAGTSAADDDGGPGGDGVDESGGTTGGPAVVPIATVAELLVPFDTNNLDLEGPSTWYSQYGKTPEIVAIPNGETIDVLVQDYASAPTGSAWLLRLQRLDDDYVITHAVAAPILDRIMGLARGDDGTFYVASGAAEEEQITLEYPAPGQYRSGVVRVVRTGFDGNVAFDVDLDMARGAAGSDAELLINPMVAATSRLAFGGGKLALTHGINTDPDEAGTRHQKAVTTHLDAATGAVTKTSSIWVSHSFDQRLMHDSTSFLEMHLGDAYPRDIAFARVEPDSPTFSLFSIKGATGANNTHTRLGNFARIENDATFGFLALFASERTPSTTAIDPAVELVAGSRELGIVRVRRDFAAGDPDVGGHLDPALPDTLDVMSAEMPRSNRLRWLTDYEATTAGQSHAERPKLVPIGGDRFVVLWEHHSSAIAYDGTWAMLIDANGGELVAPVRVTGLHLPRGDDAFRLGDRAAWITGDAAAPALRLNVVDDTLAYEMIVIE
jgi:hypothetical protein